MPLTDVVLCRLEPGAKTFLISALKGLYLQVGPSGGRWWRFEFRLGRNPSRPVRRRFSYRSQKSERLQISKLRLILITPCYAENFPRGIPRQVDFHHTVTYAVAMLARLPRRRTY